MTSPGLRAALVVAAFGAILYGLAATVLLALT